MRLDVVPRLNAVRVQPRGVAHGVAESTFGRRAVNDGKFVARLRDGARITPETLQRVSEYLHRHGMAFIDGFILQHNVNRFMQAKEGHGGSPLYTLLVAPLLLLPWTPLLAGVGQRLGKAWATPATRFLLCWSGFALLFFSLSNTKLPHYLLYGLTPLMLLCAQALAGLRSRALGLALAASQLLLFGLLSWSQQVAGWLADRTTDPLYHTLLSTASPGPAWWLQWQERPYWYLIQLYRYYQEW